MKNILPDGPRGGVLRILHFSTQKFHLEDQIVPIPGNLAQPLLGFPPDTFKVLATEIDAIVHNGADVNLVKLYAALKSVNVFGMQEVLRLAVTNGLTKTYACEACPLHINRGCVNLGSVPDRSDWFFDMTPVDYAARAIVHFVASRPVEALGQTLHIQNPSLPVNSDDFFSYFTSPVSNKKLATTAFTEWKRSLLQGATIETAPLELKKLAAGIDSFEIYLQSDKLFDSTLSSELLQTTGISYPSVNKVLLVTYTAQW
ncbi:hypothetical protein PsorP6_016072 [Peronosclerospora sorghi]|uniref:Uncharacterized protein n=1 Tax=Peronosclerospora sorghi TaxID=230839 RepID=A0ACC0WPW5_9STRA|nr:hypothetical protein PsorP6_016072 [Peronosclerospora sorghi]